MPPDNPLHRHGGRLHAHDRDEDGHDHSHHHDAAISEIDAAHLWSLDNVVLTTVGIDVGSSTSHFMFGRVHLRREASTAASRFEVVSREVLWRSAVRLTPYRDDDTIDALGLARFVADGYREAGILPDDVDAGAVILTGEALKRRNARALAEQFVVEAGPFVCASAGHHMEAVLAAHGSGAAARSRRTGEVLLNVDVGGGTTKFALIVAGEVAATVAVAVGARLVVVDANGRIVRLESPAVELARTLGIELHVGDVLSRDARARIVDRMVDTVMGLVERRPPDALTRALLVTPGWETTSGAAVAAVSISGGVAEYFYGREPTDFGDLGRDLAGGLRAAFAERALPLGDPDQGIRATVIGASQFTVQLSGNTILVTAPDRLPLRNVPVVRAPFELGGEIDAGRASGVVRAALARTDRGDPAQPVAIAFAWSGAPSFPRINALARAIAATLEPSIAAGAPIVLAIDGDVALTFGRLLRDEIAPGADVVAIDGLRLQDLDYIDIGTIREPANVVPVTIKSLLF